MSRCLQLAHLGELFVQPNPMVGSVIVRHGEVIGEGYHRAFGGPHAEVHAIQSVKEVAWLKESTLYVNLEPCSHHGKTPPCADLIIKSGIPRVVIGSVDPNPRVAGKGIARLKDAGIDVITDVLHDACRELNRRFFIYQEYHRPYITLKWAETSDGFIDRIRSHEKGVHWITGNDARVLVHRWRAEHAAILVGTNTVLNDDPALTVRAVAGRNPLRVIIDRNSMIPAHAKVLNDEAKTLVITEHESRQEGNVEWLHMEFTSDLSEKIMAELYHRNIMSVFIEGGAFTLSELIRKGLWDEVIILKGKIAFGEGLKAPDFKGMLYSGREISSCRVEIYR